MNSGEREVYIGIDYGDRRIGVAKSDPSGLIASPLTTIEVRSIREALDRLMLLIEDHQPAGVVVGYPVLRSGDRSEKCEEVDRFIERLARRYDGEVVCMDESHSSQEAEEIVHAQGKRLGRDKGRVDQIAAAVILQRFLDQKRMDEHDA